MRVRSNHYGADAFYFLEVNTRLQVEHPVTELITGLDLVELQVRVARGEELPSQDTIQRFGHAVECRLYAEDAARDFLPVTGQLLSWEPPTGDCVRVDAGIRAGSVVGIDYDPMLAKIITFGDDRRIATDRMIRALKDLRAPGLTTNQAFLIDVLQHPVYLDGALSTHFIADHLADWQPTAAPGRLERVIAATIAGALQRGRSRLVLSGAPGLAHNPGRCLRIRGRTTDELSLEVTYQQEQIRDSDYLWAIPSGARRCFPFRKVCWI